MSDHYWAETARIRALKTSIVSLLSPADGDPLDRDQLERAAALLIDAYHDVLDLARKTVISRSAEDFGRNFGRVESALSDWREVAHAFEHRIGDAYKGYVGRDSLLIDAFYNDLRQNVGEPVAALHARLRTSWLEYLRVNPWNQFMMGDDVDPRRDELEQDLKSLVFGDHLDLEDAVENLTGPLRYAFAGHLRLQSEPIDELEESLWLRPETMLVGDYWRYGKQSRIIDVLCSKGRSRRTASFVRLRDFFAADSEGDNAGGIVTVMDELLSGEKPTYYRCLMLHPDQAVRRYAVNNIDPEGLWKAVTPQTVPLATILSALERVTGSERYDDNFRRVFFNSVHKRLFNLTSRSELIYARGIVRVFSEMQFFMEDEYFEKLVRVVDYLRAKEKFFGFENSVLDDYVARLRREKEKTGSLDSESPNLTAIPAVVLRKLARDGHYWYELAMHPMFKIARETVNHINTPDRAVRVAGNHVASPDVLREIGRKRSLFGTLPARMTLLSNPRTPPTISMGYVMDLGRTEVEALLRKSTVHPELRLQLRRRLNAQV